MDYSTETPKDSLIYQTEVSMLSHTSNISDTMYVENSSKERISGFFLSVMMTKGFIGIAIFVMPALSVEIGLTGFILAYLFITSCCSVFTLMIVHVANRIGYTGSRYTTLPFLSNFIVTVSSMCGYSRADSGLLQK